MAAVMACSPPCCVSTGICVYEVSTGGDVWNSVKRSRFMSHILNVFLIISVLKKPFAHALSYACTHTKCNLGIMVIYKIWENA